MWMDIIIFFENKDNDFILNLESYDHLNISEGIRSLDPVFLKKIWKPDLFIGNVLCNQLQLVNYRKSFSWIPKSL
jgi:hypothetical protein